MIKRTIEGVPTQIYAFTLVLTETQGKGITFTLIKRHATSQQASIATREDSIEWELRPHGELRKPFSYYIRGRGGAFGRDFRPISVSWTIILTGKDDRDSPVRVSMHINLPSKPPVQEATPAPPTPTLGQLTEPTTVPIQCVRNVILVTATLASKEQATLLLDTGASRTAITPHMARELGISPTDETPRRMLVVFGGRKIEVPFVVLPSVQVGDALVRNLDVAVADVNPNAPVVDGVLGGDFLGHFKVTVDRAASRLTLDPLSPRKGLVNRATLEKALSKPTTFQRAPEKPITQTQEKRLTYIPKKVIDAKIPTIKLRSTPTKVWESDIDKMIEKYNFFVKDKNELGSFLNDFVDNGDGTVTDRVTGLMWEKAGSSSILRYREARRLVSRLNEKNSLGYDDWRIPTFEELCSLLESRKNDKRQYIDTLFDSNQSTCWTADYRVYQHFPVYEYYIIDFSSGRISTGCSHPTRLDDSFFLRAVRTIK
jgi:hypothetical protein